MKKFKQIIAEQISKTININEKELEIYEIKMLYNEKKYDEMYNC